MENINGNQDRIIIINEAVENGTIRDIMLPLMMMDNDGTGDPITIILSVGASGDVFSILPLCDVIDNLKTPTQIFLLNYAFGAGAFILMAGHINPLITKTCFKHSTIKLYAIDERLISYRGYEKLLPELYEYVLSHTDIPEEKLNDFSDQNYVMTSQELLEYGFVDTIVGEEEA